MKKSIFILALTLIAIVGFSTESFAQRTITMTNLLGSSADVKLCSTFKTLAAGETHTTNTTCTSAPCFIEINTACTGIIYMYVPCTGTGPFSSTQTFSAGGGGTPPCSITVAYTCTSSGVITIDIY